MIQGHEILKNIILFFINKSHLLIVTGLALLSGVFTESTHVMFSFAKFISHNWVKLVSAGFIDFLSPLPSESFKFVFVTDNGEDSSMLFWTGVLNISLKFAWKGSGSVLFAIFNVDSKLSKLAQPVCSTGSTGVTSQGLTVGKTALLPTIKENNC